MAELTIRCRGLPTRTNLIAIFPDCVKQITTSHSGRPENAGCGGQPMTKPAKRVPRYRAPPLFKRSPYAFPLFPVVSFPCGIAVASSQSTGISGPSLRQDAAGTMHFEPGGVSF